MYLFFPCILYICHILETTLLLLIPSVNCGCVAINLNRTVPIYVILSSPTMLLIMGPFNGCKLNANLVEVLELFQWIQALASIIVGYTDHFKAATCLMLTFVSITIASQI
jgi:hypothetical protein